MVTMPTLQTEAQSLQPDNLISLFRLDTTSLGGPLLHFVQGREETQSVVFDEVSYDPVDVEFTGLEVSGMGALPTPTIRIANTDGIWQALINTYGDLEGCTIYRLRTHKRFLDTQPDADPLAFYGPDTFKIERKVSENQVFIEWQLSAAIDQEGVMLPRRVVVRDTCLFRYRAWNQGTASFDYTDAVCPYVGSQSYDINDQPVASGANDVPSRRKTCCTTRFGAGNPLPFGGFPGVQRSR